MESHSLVSSNAFQKAKKNLSNHLNDEFLDSVLSGIEADSNLQTEEDLQQKVTDDKNLSQRSEAAAGSAPGGDSIDPISLSNQAISSWRKQIKDLQHKSSLERSKKSQAKGIHTKDFLNERRKDIRESLSEEDCFNNFVTSCWTEFTERAEEQVQKSKVNQSEENLYFEEGLHVRPLQSLKLVGDMGPIGTEEEILEMFKGTLGRLSKYGAYNVLKGKPGPGGGPFNLFKMVEEVHGQK